MQRERRRKKKKNLILFSKRKDVIKEDFPQDLSYSLAADVPLEGLQPGLPAQEVNQLEIFHATDDFDRS